MSSSREGGVPRDPLGGKAVALLALGAVLAGASLVLGRSLLPTVLSALRVGAYVAIALGLVLLTLRFLVRRAARTARDADDAMALPPQTSSMQFFPPDVEEPTAHQRDAAEKRRRAAASKRP